MFVSAPRARNWVGADAFVRPASEASIYSRVMIKCVALSPATLFSTLNPS